MKKKRNGFTLVELLGVIVILSVLVAITTPFVLDALNAGKNSSYDIMVENIVTASKMYYEECKYGNLYDNNGNKITCYNEVTLTLQQLVDMGHLPGVADKECAEDTCKQIIKNPKTDTNISSCRVHLLLSKDANGKVTYIVRSLTNGSDCPTNDYEHNGSKVLGVTN